MQPNDDERLAIVLLSRAPRLSLSENNREGPYARVNAAAPAPAYVSAILLVVVPVLRSPPPRRLLRPWAISIRAEQRTFVPPLLQWLALSLSLPLSSAA